MPQKTSNTYLFCKTKVGATEFTKLCEISTYPDITDLEDMQFGCNYEKDDFDRIKALEGQQLEYELRFGINGEFGAFAWKGDVFITPKGGAVGEIRKMQITCYPSTEIRVNN